jgi:hypothetical protein
MSVVTHARVAGALCLLVFLVGVVSVAAGIRGARLGDIQLGTDPAQVRQLVVDAKVRNAANRAIAVDYVFLTAYWAAFVALAALLGRRGGLWLVVGGLAAATATATATLDVVENLRTSGILALHHPGDTLGQGRLDALRHVSLLKWAASATTVTLLAGVFAQRDTVAVVAFVLLVLAAIGYAGLARHGLIEVYLLGLGVLTVVIGLLLVVAPASATRRL